MTSNLHISTICYVLKPKIVDWKAKSSDNSKNIDHQVKQKLKSSVETSQMTKLLMLTFFDILSFLVEQRFKLFILAAAT